MTNGSLKANELPPVWNAVMKCFLYTRLIRYNFIPDISRENKISICNNITYVHVIRAERLIQDLIK